MTFYVHTMPKARVQHRCQMCARTIRVGEKYDRGATLDGTAYTWKVCLHCQATIDFILAVLLENEYDWDLINEWEPVGLAELRVKANYRRRWTRRNGDLVDVPTLLWKPATLSNGFKCNRLVGIES